MGFIYKRLRSTREDHDLTQEKIAKAINVARSTYAGWETELDSIPLERFNDVCNVLEINMDYIVGLSDVKEKSNKFNKIDKKEVGKTLRMIRKEHNDKQETISKVIGLANSAYAAAERGENFIQTSLLIVFCKYYNVSMDYICGRSYERKINKY